MATQTNTSSLFTLAQKVLKQTRNSAEAKKLAEEVLAMAIPKTTTTVVAPKRKTTAKKKAAPKKKAAAKRKKK